MRGTPQQYKIEYEISSESLKGQKLEKCLEEKKGKTMELWQDAQRDSP